MTRSKRKLQKPPIADVIREITGAESPTGLGWVKMHCPFHEDRTPSAGVNHELERFHCFSCGRDGDGIDLLQNELRLSFTEATERAEALTGKQPTRRATGRKRRPSDLLKG